MIVHKHMKCYLKRSNYSYYLNSILIVIECTRNWSGQCQGQYRLQAEVQYRNNTFRARGQRTSWHHHLWKQSRLPWTIKLVEGQFIEFPKCSEVSKFSSMSNQKMSTFSVKGMLRKHHINEKLSVWKICKKWNYFLSHAVVEIF